MAAPRRPAQSGPVPNCLYTRLGSNFKGHARRCPAQDGAAQGAEPYEIFMELGQCLTKDRCGAQHIKART
jgi:hypothetical protein